MGSGADTGIAAEAIAAAQILVFAWPVAPQWLLALSSMIVFTAITLIGVGRFGGIGIVAERGGCELVLKAWGCPWLSFVTLAGMAAVVVLGMTVPGVPSRSCLTGALFATLQIVGAALARRRGAARFRAPGEVEGAEAPLRPSGHGGSSASRRGAPPRFDGGCATHGMMIRVTIKSDRETLARRRRSNHAGIRPQRRGAPARTDGKDMPSAC